MKRADLNFERPEALQAREPPEARGLRRDDVGLLVSTPAGHHHSRFANLGNFLEAGDLLVVNRSATLPASLPAEGPCGDFILNLSTRYGLKMWLAEPRWSPSRPGPLPLEEREVIRAARLSAKLLAPYPGQPRLRFVQFAGDVDAAMRQYGEPICYSYLKKAQPLSTYQTIFADTPGSAEMPSAGRPFSERVLACVQAKGARLATVTLHAGVSSLELEAGDLETQTLYPEPFEVPAETARAVNDARVAGCRVIAVGTTVVRALESAWDGRRFRPAKGFTRLFVRPGRGVHVDGLITGFHDPKASHLAMLYALAGKELVQDAYAEAVREGYLWHEFGDSHLILPHG